MSDKVDFVPVDKHGSFLQVDIIILGVRCQVCPKYPIHLYLISFQYLKQNVKDEVNFLPPVKHQRFLQIDTTILGACGQACPYYPK